MFVFASDVHGVADAHDVDAVVNQRHHVVHVPQRLADGIPLGRFDKVRFGVEFHEVRYIGVVPSVLCDKAALPRKHTDGAVRMRSSTDFKQMPGVV